MLPHLEERFDVLAVDLPGFGRSEPLPPGVDSTPEALAGAVGDEMRRAGFDRAHIAGNSLGGWIALELARCGGSRTVTAISPAGLQHGREKEWGAGVLRALRWVAQNVPVTERLVRNPVARTLLMSSLYGARGRRSRRPCSRRRSCSRTAPASMPRSRTPSRLSRAASRPWTPRC